MAPSSRPLMTPGNERADSSTATDAAGPTENERGSPELALQIRWGRKRYAIEMPPSATLQDLKGKIFEYTEVLPKRQKVLGLPKFEGKLPHDDVRLEQLKVKTDHPVMIVGTTEQDIQKLNAAAAEVDIVDDLDLDLEDDVKPGEIAVRNPGAVKWKLSRRLSTISIQFINQPREGKKLLVLDLDYTLFDCKGLNSAVIQYSRPGLHEFLTEVYEHYDLVIWSQTSWRWLEAKITELGMLMNPNYRLCFVMDRTSMFSVTSLTRKKERTHEVKALEILWKKFPDRWNERNTIHVDDLSRNFVLNPRNGLKVSAYKNALASRSTDRELFSLKTYLNAIALREDDFTKLDHKEWKSYAEQHSQPSLDGDSQQSAPSNS